MTNGEQQSLPFDSEDRVFSRLELARPIVFFDLETTGLDFNQDRIVQFAFLKVNPDRTQEDWEELVNPGIPIPPEATQVHHITDEMVADKLDFKALAGRVLEFIENCDLSGYNVLRFDVPFLQAEMERSGCPLDLTRIHIIDAQVIFHKNEPRDLSAAYRFYCNAQHVDAHDAMGDVKATLEILDAQLKTYPSLPRNMKKLADYCRLTDNRYVTKDRKFYWRHNQPVLSFGKHKGKSLKWLVENDRDYLMWMQNGDFTDETRQLIQDALQGIFPQRKQK